MGTQYISAGAGSGKTYRLTHDLAALLVPEEAGVDASGIILTTFTKAAAADFVRRAREVLINESHRPDKAAELDGALIGTVHSICERFVKKYWYRLGLTLPLNIISEEDKKLYVNRTAEIVATEEDVLFFSRFARDLEMDADFWKGNLTDIINMKYSFGIKDLEPSCKASCERVDAVFRTDVSSGDLSRLSRFFDDLLQLVKAEKPNKTNINRMMTLERLCAGSDFQRAKFFFSKSNVDPEGKLFNAKGLWDKMDQIAGIVDVTCIAERYVSSRLLGDRLKECIRKLFTLAKAWEKEYVRFKEENRLLDFNDLEQKFLRILYEDGFEDVRDDMEKSFKVMMVDEFQDSNPVQIEIFRKMMELVASTTLVGDRKQAIYGFRGTDSTLVDEFIADLRKDFLEDSRRSREELVKAANDIFRHAFADDRVPYDNVVLNPVRRTYPEMGPALQHWQLPPKDGYVALGRKIRETVEAGLLVGHKDKEGNERLEPIEYGDIAILLRNARFSIDEVVKGLRTAGVPVSIQEADFIEWAEVQLILSLVRYVYDPGDDGAKADILHLVKSMPTEAIVKEHLAGYGEEAKALFAALGRIRSRISVLYVEEIVESLVLELDLFEGVARWGQPETRRRNLGFMVGLARQYEQQCGNTNSSATLPGYLAFVSDYKTQSRTLDKTNTVKVLTCHGAKGLEWPMVILDQLSGLNLSEESLYKREFSGVHPFREADGIRLQVLPQLLSKDTGVGFKSPSRIPAPIVERFKDTPFFQEIKDRVVKEERRLLYVAFTRARDYLVTLGKDDSTYSWITGCKAGINEGPTDEGFLLWHAAHPSVLVELPAPEAPEEPEEIVLEPWAVPEEKDFGKKYRSPSKAGHSEEGAKPVDRSSRPVKLKEVFRGVKVVQDVRPDDSDVCGTCVHDIFAAYDPARGHAEMVSMAADLVDGRGLGAELPSAESIVDAAGRLYEWLERTYEPGTPLCELPFSVPGEGGTVIRGEMDLVWELPGKKCVLVDHKSYHVTEDFDDPKAWNEYYGYAPQLKAYKETLEAAGYQVLDTYIHYFFQGRLVRFDFEG